MMPAVRADDRAGDFTVPRKLMLIVNPHSGRGLSKNTLGGIVAELGKSDCAVTVFFIGSWELETLIREQCRDYDIIACVGGDGTLSGVVSGLVQVPDAPPVGYIPTGTANDMATTLALSRSPVLAARAILEGQPVPVDVGRFGDKYFTYIAAFGAFTGVAYKTKQSAKRALGRLAYIFGGIASVPKISAKHTIVEYDGGVIEGNFIFGSVSNSTSVASLVKLNPAQVDLSDGLFEVILVRRPINIGAMRDILASVMTKNYDNDNVKMFHSKTVKFTFDEDIPWTRDGEDGGAHREITISNCREAVRLIR